MAKRFLTGGEITGCYHVIGNKPIDRLLVTEGYATGSSLHEATGDTVAVAFYADNLKPVAKILREKFPSLKIILCADNDTQTEGNPGVRKATEAAQEIGGLLAIPNCEGDFNDIAINKGLEIVQQIVDVAKEPPQSNEAAKGNGKEPTNEESPRHSQATTLVEMSLQKYEFGISTTGETFAISKTGPRLVAMLRGSRTSLRGQLAKEYFREYHRAASQQALADALLVIDGLAQEAEERELHLRVASHDNDLWIDMCDQTGRAIRITSQRWSIEPQPPMLFRRTALNGVLPEPESGGSLDDLWSLLNVTEPDRPLIIAWLIAALFPDMPHPVLSFFGEQGTGKTTAHKMLVTAIDPGPVPIRKPPPRL